MPRYNQNQRQPVDYANIYFGFVVWRAIFKVLGAIGAAGFVVVYLILDGIWPDAGPSIIGGIPRLSSRPVGVTEA